MPMHQKARADHVRSRLNQESNENLQQAKRRLVNGASDQFLSGQVTPLNEIAKGGKPAVRRKLRPGWRLISFLLCGLLSFALFTAWQSPQYKIDNITINGLQRLDAEEVLKTINLSGEHIFVIDPQMIKNSISSDYPELWNIQVQVSLPNFIEVYVIEQQPMIAWQMKDDLIWIDTEGYLIPARGIAGNLLTIKADSYPRYKVEHITDQFGIEKTIQDKQGMKPNQPQYAFFAQPKRIDQSLLTAILQLNAWMPEEETLLFQKIRGLGWRDTRGWDVFVGQKLENINDKMVMYETIVQELEKDNIYPTMVSVEFLHAPYYRTD